MDKVKKVVDSIIDELDGRKGFDFYDFDEEILEEIKDELVKLILPVVGVTLPSHSDVLVDGHKGVMDFRKELKDSGKDEEFADINSWQMGINWLWEYLGN